MKKRPDIALISMCLLLTIITASCNKPNQSAMQQASPAQAPDKRYHLQGKVFSIDKQVKMVNVDSEAIPDVMDAITIRYQLKPLAEMYILSPGVVITPAVVVQ